LGSIATKSMTVKNGGNTIDAVEGLALWVSHCISRACALAGWDFRSVLHHINCKDLIQ